ncbi:MAG: aspartate/methionine/tyrosine aminotransferase [Bradymonadia bacterium]|jgi:aspartate/methionine/tyrosine aminotransferase
MKPATRLGSLGLSLIRRTLADAPADALSLGLGESGVDVAQELRAALLESPAMVRARYGPNAGQPALRAAIASRAGVSVARVIVTVGAQEALALAILGTVNSGDDVLVPDPGFPTYASLVRIAGGTPVPVRLPVEEGFRATVAAYERARTPKTTLVVLNNPANPSGALTESGEWRSLAAWADEHSLPWVSDEIYGALAPGFVSLAQHSSGGVVVDGLAKSHGLAGWRIGWAIVPDGMAAPLTALHQNLVTSAPPLLQDAALGAFTDAGDALTSALVKRLEGARAEAREVLSAGGWQVAGGDVGFYLMVRCPVTGQTASRVVASDDIALCRYLMHQRGVVTIPGSAFGGGGAGWLRISVATDANTLQAALTRLCPAPTSADLSR